MYFAGDIGRGINDAFKQVERATASITSGTFTVNKDNVLAAARIIEQQADILRDRARSARTDLRMNPPGNDDVSIQMAAAWNAVLVEDEDSYQNRIAEYIGGLRKLSVQLGDAARAYGYSEEEISAAYGNAGE